MTERVGDTLIIESEPERICELCGKLDECRPYGPNEEQVCFECGMKDREAAERAVDKRVKDKRVKYVRDKEGVIWSKADI